MGVPRFFRWVVKKYPNTFIKGKVDKHCSYLCYDVNGLLHPCVRQSIAERGAFVMEDVEKKVREKMFEICKITNPTKGILICIDGVAPLAKMYQQRYRRYKSVYDKQIEREMYAKHNERYPFDWDTNAITPSTDFMKHMDALFDTISRELEGKYPSCKMYYSPSSQAGEGEHKIMEILRTIPNQESDSYFIHGLDADLIFLSMGLGKENIYLMREQSDSLGFLNVTQLKNKLFTEIQARCKHALLQKDVEKDFMVLSYFLGNDFLPAIFSLHIDQNDEIIKAYCEVVDRERKNLVGGTSIDWGVFSRICEQFSQTEYVHLKNKVKRFLSSKEDDHEHTTRLQKDIFWARQRPKEDTLRLLEGGWKERFYRHYFHFEMNEWNQKNAMMVNYMEGLQWNLTYYLSGVKNWQWSYRYHAAPFFADLYNFLSKRGGDTVLQACRQVALPSRPPDNVEQLLVVLPPQSSHLIPMPYRELMTNYKVSNIIDIYPIGFNLDYYYKQKDWEYKPILPDIEFSRIQKEIYRIRNNQQNNKQ
jgi:5'-3' exoribonuclease 2